MERKITTLLGYLTILVGIVVSFLSKDCWQLVPTTACGGYLVWFKNNNARGIFSSLAGVFNKNK